MCNQYKNTNEAVYISLFLLSLGDQYVISYTSSISQLGLDTFQLLKTHTWPEATTLDRVGLDTSSVNVDDHPSYRRH